MKDIVKILELDKYELGIIINALNELRNKNNTLKEENENLKKDSEQKMKDVKKANEAANKLKVIMEEIKNMTPPS